MALRDWKEENSQVYEYHTRTAHVHLLNQSPKPTARSKEGETKWRGQGLEGDGDWVGGEGGESGSRQIYIYGYLHVAAWEGLRATVGV